MIPWDSWQNISAQNSRLDNCLQPCSDTCDELCVRQDMKNYLKDFTHRLIHQPPNVRPVNKNGAMVLNRKGQIMGPYSYIQWLEYSYLLVDKFHELLKNENAFSWADLFFRDERDFYSGSYGHFSPISLLFARKLACETVAHFFIKIFIRVLIYSIILDLSIN